MIGERGWREGETHTDKQQRSLPLPHSLPPLTMPYHAINESYNAHALHFIWLAGGVMLTHYSNYQGRNTISFLWFS